MSENKQLKSFMEYYHRVATAVEGEGGAQRASRLLLLAHPPLPMHFGRASPEEERVWEEWRAAVDTGGVVEVRIAALLLLYYACWGICKYMYD